MQVKNLMFASSMLGMLLVMPSCIPAKQPENGHQSHVDVAGFSLDKVNKATEIIPVAVLGSGPAGLDAATYAGRAGFKVVVFEGPMPGGLLTQTTLVENWPGQVEINGPDIIAHLKEQATKWGAQFVQETIERVDFSSWPYKLHSQEGKEYSALTVILATGATPRYLGIPGEQEYWGSGVTTCAVCDAPFFKDEEVVVVGGGDSAAEEAMQLAPYAKKITILVRKDHMRASKAMQDRLKGYKHIEVIYNVEVKEIKGDGTNVNAITLYNNKDDSSKEMPIAGVFLAAGHIPNTKFLEGSLKLTSEGYIDLATRTQETSVPAVYAAGDVSDARYRQAGVSSGHGIAAGLDATFFLNAIGYNEEVQNELKAQNRLVRIEEGDAFEVSVINELAAFEDAVLSSQTPVIVDFYADWCPTCMQMLPAFAAVAQEFEGRVLCIKVDADHGQEIMKKYEVQKVPGLLVFKDGQVKDRFVKTMTRAELTELAQGLL